LRTRLLLLSLPRPPPYRQLQRIPKLPTLLVTTGCCLHWYRYRNLSSLCSRNL
jgi:hypothetical protein